MNNRQKVLLVCIICACLSIGLLIFMLSGNKKAPVSPPNAAQQAAPAPTSPPLDENSIPAKKDDPFAGAGAVSAGGVSYGKPAQIEGAAEADTAPKLLQATDRYLLFNSFNGNLYIHPLNGGNRTVIDKKIVFGLISDDEKYVFYAKDNVQNTVVSFFDTESGQKVDLMTLEKGAVVKSASYLSGKLAIVYGVNNGAGPFYTRAAPLPQFVSSFGAIVGKPVEVSSPALASFRNEIFSYDAKKKSIASIESGVQTIPRFPLKSADAASVQQIKFSPSGNWLAVYSDASKALRKIETSQGAVEGFTQVYDARWIDDQTVLVNDDFKLYAYSLKTKEKQLLLDGAFASDATKKGIYAQGQKSSILFFSKK